MSPRKKKSKKSKKTSKKNKTQKPLPKDQDIELNAQGPEEQILDIAEIEELIKNKIDIEPENIESEDEDINNFIDFKYFKKYLDQNDIQKLENLCNLREVITEEPKINFQYNWNLEAGNKIAEINNKYILTQYALEDLLNRVKLQNCYRDFITNPKFSKKQLVRNIPEKYFDLFNSIINQKIQIDQTTMKLFINNNDEIIAIKSKNYNHLPFQSFLNFVQSTGLPINKQYSYINNRQINFVLELTEKPSNVGNFQVCLRLEQGFDSSIAASLFLIRLECSNGMTSRFLVDKNFKIHLVRDPIIALQEIIEEVKEQAELMIKKLENAAKAEKIDPQLLLNRYSFIIPKKHHSGILEELQKEKIKKANDWDLYNAITSYAKTLDYTMSQWIINQANRIIRAY